ncbi:MAG: acyl-CoA dehydrogenase family protein [Candidatus Heimdallarchaeota archaeon]
MDLSLSQEQELLQDSIREFLEREVKPKIQDYDREQKHLPPLRHLGDLGILGLCIPKKWGGAGFDYLALAVVCEELEAVDTSLRVVLSVHTGLNSLALYQWGTKEQKDQYLIPQARGVKIATFALTEPSSGSDPAALQTRAIRQGDEYVITGNKSWISLADIADHFLVIARLDQEKRGTKNMGAFIVERNSPGVTTSTLKDKLGVRACNTGSIHFQDVRIPSQSLLGQEGEGFKIAMSALDNGRFTVAAGSVGLIRACIEESVHYAKSREAYNQEIGRFQLIQEHLAYMQAGYDTSQMLVWKAAWLKNQGKRNSRETSMAKWYATNQALDAANRAIQIHGAYGYSADYPVERFWRNARGAMIYEGTDEIQKLIQGAYAMGYRKDRPLRRELPPFLPNEDD